MDVENPRLLVGSKIQSLPEILILPLDAASKVSIVDPPAPTLPDLNVMVPVPLVGGEVNVNAILVLTPIFVAPAPGLMELNAKETVVKL